MASHEVSVKLGTATIFILALGLGIAIGIPVGIAAYQYGWSKGASGQHLTQQVGVTPLGGNAVCVNGIAYAPDSNDTYPAWQGVYRPITQGQPRLNDKNGQEVIQRSIPVRCAIQLGSEKA
ncbi:hypothetical protein [Pseudomonas syringae]|uniref:hypothetical protein n=1 Tax=Pseudomonas syringae TaxID=317 RepID=UPI00245B61CE|nr:hypothetical protein [Pseudomonas syringae]MDH4602392.1 hypothetical protein [Pseudomonas syringae pv. papulans]